MGRLRECCCAVSLLRHIRQTLLAISSMDCKIVVDLMAKQDGPVEIDDDRCATDLAISHVCLRRMDVTLGRDRLD